MREFHNIDYIFTRRAGGFHFDFSTPQGIVVERQKFAADWLMLSSNSRAFTRLLPTEEPETQVLKLSYILLSLDPNIYAQDLCKSPLSTHLTS